MKKQLTRILSLMLTLCLLLTLLPTVVLASNSEFDDMPKASYWSYEALNNAINNGLLQGYNNRINPKDCTTRAQLSAILNRAFGAIDKADISGFSDVSPSDWYYADMAKALHMGTFLGNTDKLLLPLDAATRQETFCVIARALMLSSENLSVLDRYSDKASIAPWASEAIAALTENGYINGSDGKINPNGKITREEIAQLMDNIIKTYISKAGTYTFTTENNVMINQPDVTLKDTIINGDLIIGEGVGNGDVTLDNTKVTGRVLVRGGGEHSIHVLNNSLVNFIEINKTGIGGIRIFVDILSSISNADVIGVNDGIVFEGRFNDINIQSVGSITLHNTTVNTVNVHSAGSSILLNGNSSVGLINVDNDATDVLLNIEDSSIIENASGIAIPENTKPSIPTNPTIPDNDTYTEVTSESQFFAALNDANTKKIKVTNNILLSTIDLIGYVNITKPVLIDKDVTLTFYTNFNANINLNSTITNEGVLVFSGGKLFIDKDCVYKELDNAKLTFYNTSSITYNYYEGADNSNVEATSKIFSSSITNSTSTILISRYAYVHSQDGFKEALSKTIEPENTIMFFDSFYLDTGTFSLSTDYTLSSGHTLYISSGASLIIEPEVTLTIEQDAQLTIYGNLINLGSCTNNGICYKFISGTISGTSINTTATGSYSFEISVATESEFISAANNTNCVCIELAEDITLTQSLTIKSSLIIPDGKTLTIAKEATFSLERISDEYTSSFMGNIINNGNFIINSPLYFIDNGKLDNNGLLVLNAPNAFLSFDVAYSETYDNCVLLDNQAGIIEIRQGTIIPYNPYSSNDYWLLENPSEPIRTYYSFGYIMRQLYFAQNIDEINLLTQPSQDYIENFKETYGETLFYDEELMFSLCILLYNGILSEEMLSSSFLSSPITKADLALIVYKYFEKLREIYMIDNLYSENTTTYTDISLLDAERKEAIGMLSKTTFFDSVSDGFFNPDALIRHYVQSDYIDPILSKLADIIFSLHLNISTLEQLKLHANSTLSNFYIKSDITLDSDLTITTSITILEEATLTTGNNTLEIRDSQLLVNGNLTISENGYLNNFGVIYINGYDSTFTVNGVYSDYSAQGPEEPLQYGHLFASDESKITFNADTIINGLIEINGSSSLINTKSLTNNGYITIDTNSSFENNDSSSLTNNGTIWISFGSRLSINLRLTNNGTIKITDILSKEGTGGEPNYSFFEFDPDFDFSGNSIIYTLRVYSEYTLSELLLYLKDAARYYSKVFVEDRITIGSNLTETIEYINLYLSSTTAMLILEDGSSLTLISSNIHLGYGSLVCSNGALNKPTVNLGLVEGGNNKKGNIYIYSYGFYDKSNILTNENNGAIIELEDDIPVIED